MHSAEDLKITHFLSEIQVHQDVVFLSAKYYKPRSLRVGGNTRTQVTLATSKYMEVLNNIGRTILNILILNVLS